LLASKSVAYLFDPKKGPSLAKNKINHDDAVLVIGLGRFGGAIATELARTDREVLAIDSGLERVQRFSTIVTHAVAADVTNIDALRQIGAEAFGTAVVAVGSSVEASVLITANLVELGVPNIWAKAISASHGMILTKIGASHVIQPEQEAGERVAHLLSDQLLDYTEVEPTFVMARMFAPGVLHGKTLAEAGTRRDYRITVVGVKSEGADFTYATADTAIHESDQIIVAGRPEDVDAFAKLKS
jgi:trk system potassium uptake protein